MKKFLVRILFFLIPLVILALPLDRTISHFLSKSNSYPGEFEVMKDIYSGKIDCDIAVYGSSRAWVHINPQILEDSLGLTAYNFGIDGHNFWLQYLRHLEFLKHNKKPEYIIVAMDVFSLRKGKELYQLNQFLPYMLWNDTIKTYTSSYIGFQEIDYEIPLVRYMGKVEAINLAIKNMIMPAAADKKLRNKGFCGRNKQWNNDLDRAIAVLGKDTIKTDEASVDLFLKFIRDCKASGIKVILVYTPEYVEGQKFVHNRNEILRFYNTIAEHNGLLFLDYSMDELCYQKDMFYNSNHLNSTGANLFSSKLAADLKKSIKKNGFN